MTHSPPFVQLLFQSNKKIANDLARTDQIQMLSVRLSNLVSCHGGRGGRGRDLGPNTAEGDVTVIPRSKVRGREWRLEVAPAFSFLVRDSSLSRSCWRLDALFLGSVTGVKCSSCGIPIWNRLACSTTSRKKWVGFRLLIDVRILRWFGESHGLLAVESESPVFRGNSRSFDWIPFEASVHIHIREAVLSVCVVPMIPKSLNFHVTMKFRINNITIIII